MSILRHPDDKRWWTSSSGRIELQMTLEQAESASHSGDCEDDVRALMAVPEIKAQLDALKHSDVAAELKGYGAWDADELADEDMALVRLLWIAGGDIRDENCE